MSQFEENLWSEVLRMHGAGLARARPSIRKTSWRGRPRVLAGSTLALAGVLATATLLLLGPTASQPAFAVTRNPNGTVTVKLIRLSGIAGANHRLAAMGVRARIVTVMELAKYVAKLHVCQGRSASPVQTLTLVPASIPRRQVLLLAADRAGYHGYYPSAVGTGELGARRSPAADRPVLVAAALAASLAHAGNVRLRAARIPMIHVARVVAVYCGRAFSWPAGSGSAAPTGHGTG